MSSIVSVTAEKVEKNIFELKITVKAERFSTAMDLAAHKIAQTTSVSGHSKGEKISRHMIKKTVGTEELYHLAIEDMLVDVYQEAVNESGCEPIDDPKDIDIIQVEDGKDFVFQAKVEVKPEVVLGEYKNVKISKKAAIVTSEQVDEELKRLQYQHEKTLELDEGASVDKGDVVVVDFEGFTDNGESAETKGEKCELSVGSGFFIPGFDEKLIGIPAGRESEINVVLPAQNANGEQVKKQVIFKVRVCKIKRKIIPPLDDDFAKTYSAYDTLDALKEGIKGRLLQAAEKDIENEYRDAIVKKVVEHAVVEVPDVMTKKRFEKIYQGFQQNLQNSGIDPDDHFKNIYTTKKAFVEQIRHQAEDSVKAEIVLEQIAKVEGIEITDDDFNSEIVAIAEEYKQSPSSILKIMGQLGQEEFRQNMLIERVSDFLVDLNN